MFLEKIHPELSIDDFCYLSGTINFYSFVRAIMLRQKPDRVMDFGAGRGAFAYEKSILAANLRDFRYNGAKVVACDVDEAVLSHPCSDEQVVITPGQPLPFADNTFGLIVSDMTFEHIADPEFVSKELLRVLKPGGYICARTPNKYGYVAFASSMIPNKLHAHLLRKIQPNRESRDVFPTVYKMNTKRELNRLFKGCKVSIFAISGEPSYYFGSRILYNLLLFVHKLLPQSLALTLCVFIRKPE